MKTILDAILKLIAFILAGILIVAIPLCLLFTDLGDVIFNQEEIGSISEDVIINSQVIPAALEFMTNRRAEQISNKIEDTDRPEGKELNLYNLIYGMKDEDWINFQQALLADDVIGGWVVQTVGGFFNWLDSEDPFPIIRWDVKPLIRKMGGPEGKQAVVAYYESLPDCTDLQMEEMQTQPGDPLPRAKMVEELCKLSTFPHNEQIQVYNDVMQMVVDAMPPEYDVTQALLKESTDIKGSYTLKWMIRSFRWRLDIVLLIPLALLFLILLFGVRSLEGLGQWWGIPLVGGGLISLITALLAVPLWRGVLTGNLMPDTIPQTSLLYVEIVNGTSRVIGPIINPLVWQAFLILIIGAGLLAMAFILRMRQAGSGPSRP
jgi:hypothetical protein